MTAHPAWAGLSILLTGGQGFIGSWLAERLLDRGARVLVPWRECSEESRFHQQDLASRCDRVKLDLLDPASMVRVLDEHEVQVVFHLAAHTTVGTGSRSPFATFQTNTCGTYNLLEACRVSEESERRVVVASSAHVYGPNAEVPLWEECGLRPSNPYDVSKACADMIARSYAATHGMAVAVTRMGNVYGGGDLNYSRLIPATARALVRGERPTIRSDGTPERDYLYVEDAVDAYLAVADSLAKPELRGRPWNAGGDSPVAVVDVVRQMIAASGREIDPEVQASMRLGDGVDSQRLDSSAIREELGWAPRWDLDSGLRKTYAWYERMLV